MSELIFEAIEQFTQHQSLDTNQSLRLFSSILQSSISPLQISAFLTALKVKGENEAELYGAIQALMAHHVPFDIEDIKANAIVADCCGTGGDGQSTLNISTAVAFIVSTQNIKIAKHGNSAISSKCGASDIIHELGINVHASSKQAITHLREDSLCFLHAPNYHPITKKIATVRQSLKYRTIFNLLGPFVNPAKPSYQLIGVYHPKYTSIGAKVLKQLGSKKALVIHGQGTDELAIHGTSRGHLLNNGKIKTFSISPEDVGLKRYDLNEIKGGTVQYNKEALLQLLRGYGAPAYRAIVALNAGALFFVTGISNDIRSGVVLAQQILNTDQGYQKVEALRRQKC